MKYHQRDMYVALISSQDFAYSRHYGNLISIKSLTKSLSQSSDCFIMRNRILLQLLFIAMSTWMFADSKVSTNAVSMESYEQGWLDSEGTIALKNNTDVDIRNVSFTIKYLDMNGKPLDYEDFAYDIKISPGMTKKLNIPAYEHQRYYHYYKTKDGFGHPAFKIEYELKGYNLTKAEMLEESDASEGYSFLLAIFLLGAYIGLYILVVVMANRYHRNPVGWLFLSILLTPILVSIILLCIGDAQESIFD